MSKSWSSKQRINHEDLVSLQKDLFNLSMNLQNMDSNPTGIMRNTNIMTLDTILRDILINHKRD